MNSTILFWALVLHCHHDCTFANWARTLGNDPQVAVIAVFRTFAECEKMNRDPPKGESFTCEIRKVAVDGGQIAAVAP